MLALPRRFVVFAEEFGRCGPQRAGDLSEAQQRDVALAALDGADEGAVQPARLGQPRLREVQREPPLAETRRPGLLSP